MILVDHGVAAYEPIWVAMRDFTDQRTPDTPDACWIVEHPPVFTQGQAGKPDHILHAGDIPVVQSDRGGQVTYHGPGQVVIYVLVDVRRAKMNVRQLVNALENAVIAYLLTQGITANARCDAPGVYVNGAKICSIGLRIRRGCSYHGIAFNADMDLQPFKQINPCGFESLQMTQLRDHLTQVDLPRVKTALAAAIIKNLTTSVSTPVACSP